MGYLTKENTLLACEIEDTEGIYKAPVADTSFLQVLSDGLEMAGAKELKERNILTGSIGSVTPRVGQKSVSGSIGVEFKSSGVAGNAPEWDSLMMSILGSKRQITAQVTTGTGHTAQRLEIEDADIGDFSENMVVLVRQPSVNGGFFVAPIVAVDDSIGAAYIDFLFAHSENFVDNVVIEKMTQYVPANDGHKTLSVTRYLENKIIDKGIGCRVSGMSLNNFTTGGISDLAFSFEGMDYDQETGVIPFTPAFDSALPPLVLNACVWQDGCKIALNDLAFSIENTIGWITSTCSETGRISSRITKRNVSGTINPYKSDSDVDNYNAFKNNTPFSLFFYAANPTAVAGEFKDVIAVYMPNCITTELALGDKDGVITEDISFSSDRGSDGLTNEIFVTLI